MKSSNCLPGLALFCVVAVAACADSDQPPGPIEVDSSTPESRLVAGQAAYERICADCHRDGKNGAPRTGDVAAWQNRSPLWQAVLFRHAEEGYLNMPPRGGSELADDAIDAAAEYMLSITFPEYSPDRVE